jgi:hypothetical protein
VKDSEKEEARRWLEGLTRLHEQNEVVIREIATLGPESTPQDWDKAYSNANVRALMGAIHPVKELPKPKQKELRKLKQCYTDLVSACIKAGHLYLKAYYDEHLGRIDYHKMIFWTSFANGLLEDFSRDLDKVRQEIEISK